MFTNILIPLDGSARAERALPIAERVARARGATLLLVRVVADLIDTGAYMVPTATLSQSLVDRELEDARVYLESLAETYRGKGLQVKTQVEMGVPTQTLLDLISARKIDGVIIGSHGRSGLARWALGSVAQAIVRHSTAPVLLLRQQGPALDDDRDLRVGQLRVLIPLDGSAVAEAALEPALLLGAVAANGEDFEAHIARVIPFANTPTTDTLRDAAREEAQAYVERIAKQVTALGEPHARVTTSVITEMDVADAIARLTRSGELVAGATVADGFDLLAMATHGRTGLPRLAMGSVTERVLSATSVPALIIRPARITAQAEQPAARLQSDSAPVSWPALF